MLDSKTIKTLKKIVNSRLPDASYKAFIFGSRVVGQSRPFGDIDVGIMGEKTLPAKNYIEIIQALEDSDIPYRTEVVDFATVTDRFKKQALANTIEL